MTEKYTYELWYYKLNSESWAAESEYFDSWDEAMEKAKKLDIAEIDFEKGDIMIAECWLDEEGYLDSPDEILKALIEDDKIVDWI